MRRLWMSLLLVPVMVAAVASAAWAAPMAGPRPGRRLRPAPRRPRRLLPPARCSPA